MPEINLSEMIEKVTHVLPAQGPIKEFIHHNTLHAFQGFEFNEAKGRASQIYSSRENMPLSYFREKYAQGEISQEMLASVAARVAQELKIQDAALVESALHEFVEINDERVLKNLLNEKFVNLSQVKKHLSEFFGSNVDLEKNIRRRVEKQFDSDWNGTINPVLFRFVGCFLDQGIALWAMPHRNESFLQALLLVATNSKMPLALFLKNNNLKVWLEKDCEAIIEEILKKILGDEALYEKYIHATLLAHPGWSGIVESISQKTESLSRKRTISLKEFLAFKLILEWEFIQFYAPGYVPLNQWIAKNGPEDHAPSQAGLSAVYFLVKTHRLDEKNLRMMQVITQSVLQNIWQEAFEKTCYAQILTAIQKNARQHSAEQLPKSVQVVFCIDDRECSFRRHLEEIDKSVETHGWAGFFGIDFYFQSLNDSVPIKMCPPIIKPKHYVREFPRKGYERAFEQQKKGAERSAMVFEMWREASSSLILGFLASSAIGHFSVLRLLQLLLHPKRALQSTKTKQIHVPTDLSMHKEGSSDFESHPVLGFTFGEMAERVEDVLKGMGLVQKFAPLVVFIGHGSSSVNNPHFAAYDCGACSGKPGGANARAFASMANLEPVREMLAKKGIMIPASTWFLGGYHDTATDEVKIYDLEKAPTQHEIKIENFVKVLEKAKGRNAKERCRRFAITSKTISEKDAIAEVRNRTIALVEPRPELGHAGNVSCIIGTRNLTRNVFLDRRAFLNSYDPKSDKEGKILLKILSAVFPVCGGINLEYYFSRIDPAVYGCGTKLSHNVVGLVGVCNGIDDDLRTGLPVQMTEVHDPLRLMVLIEQTPSLILQVLNQAPSLAEWVDKKWINLFCIDPETSDMFSYSHGVGFSKYMGPSLDIPVYSTSLECYANTRNNSKVALISGV